MTILSIQFISLVIGAYLFGSIPAAYLAGRLSRGIDLREYGSGNVGLGNLWEMTSKKVSIPVIIFDFGKGMAMVGLARWLGYDIGAQGILGVAAVVGHDWTVFLRFQGGRGILTLLGVILILMPWGMIAFLGFALLTLKLRSSPLPVLLGIAAQPVVSVAIGEPLSLSLCFVVLLVIVIIRRLTAPRAAPPENKKRVLLNRLLFDRDIRDREEWLYRVPDEANLTGAERARLEKKRRKKGMF